MTVEWAGKGVGIFLLLFFASRRDIQTRTVPDFYSALLVGISLIPLEPEKLIGILSAVPFLVAAIVIGGIGGADIKIMGAAGMVLGLPGGIIALIIGLSLMLIYHAINFRRNRSVCTRSYPLIPFLSIGIIFIYIIQAI